MKLAQRTALVTGAGNGIGRAIATALGREGAHILIADRANAEASAAEMVAAGIDAHGVTMDVTSEDDVARMAEVAAARFGGLPRGHRRRARPCSSSDTCTRRRGCPT